MNYRWLVTSAEHSRQNANDPTDAGSYERFILSPKALASVFYISIETNHGLSSSTVVYLTSPIAHRENQNSFLYIPTKYCTLIL